MPIRPAFACSFLLSFAVAQTYVVDGANGPGAQFTSLVDAVAAVPEGAVLVVRQGTYLGPVISGKSLTLLGEPGAVLLAGLTGALRVDSLASHQAVLARGFGLVPIRAFGRVDIVCDNNLGSVILDGLAPSSSGVAGFTYVTASSCAHLLLRHVTVGSCEFQSGNTVLLGSSVVPSTNLAVAIRQNGGTLQIVNSVVIGSVGFGLQGGAGVHMTGGDLRVLGGGTLSGGAAVGALPGYAVAGTGTVRIDPTVQVLGHSPAYQSGVVVTAAPQAFVTVDDPSLGAPVTALLHGPHGDLGALAVALSGPSYTFPGIVDRFFWNPATLVTLAIGVPMAGAPVAGVVALQNHASFLGLPLVWHGITHAPATGLQVSNPVFHIVH